VRTPPLILVVDDDKSNVDILRTRLQAQGYEVVSATDGEAALEAAQAHRPDLILLDVNMPKLDGLEVCRRLKADATLPFMPIVLVTARAEPRDVVAGLDAGADEYLTKPVEATALMARVRSMLRMKELHDRVQEQAAMRLGRLKRFFSPALAELIVTGGVDDPLRTHRREVAIVILDLVGFGAFAETAEPEEVMSVLRQYHAEMGRLVLAHEGTLERFAGDAIIVVFNDPVEIPDAPARALRMAWAMRQRARELAHEWDKRGWRLPLRIGVAMGHATIGAFGFEERLDYGVVGRVNGLAAVLCNAADGGHVLISQKVAAASEALADLQEIEVPAPRGTTRPIRAFRVLGLKG
jgi:DNA-binding response OmpR family regulator